MLCIHLCWHESHRRMMLVLFSLLVNAASSAWILFYNGLEEYFSIIDTDVSDSSGKHSFITVSKNRADDF